jgi:hypothetical protein
MSNQFYAVVFLLFTSFAQAYPATKALQDGCYQMVEKISGGITDAGAICLEGLTNESVGMNLKIVTVDSEGHKHFCGESALFSTLQDGAGISSLSIQILQPNIKIQFAGTSEAGILKIGKTNLNYRYISDISSAKFFSQCHF